jgi:uncharacterized repeat protein (TIGR02543 family)
MSLTCVINENKMRERKSMSSTQRIKVTFFVFLILFFLGGCSRTEFVKITFDTNGGSPVFDVMTERNNPVLPEDPTKEGYTFDGWYFDPGTFGSAFEEGMTLDGDVTLHAKWITNAYTIRFDTEGETADAVTRAFDTDIFPLETPVRDGFVFLGWYADEAYRIPFVRTTMPAHDITLYAKWGYRVAFDTGYFIDVEDQYVEPETKLRIPYVYRIGHTLEGWYRSLYQGEMADARWSFAQDVVQEHMTLYANWTVNQYTITFDTGHEIDLQPMTDYYDADLVAPEEPILPGSIFAHWYEEGSPDVPYVFSRMPGHDVHLFAQWHNRIEFETYDGSHVDPITTLAGNTVDEPESPVKTGHTFDGWYADEGFDEPFEFDTMPDSNVILHAKWTINAHQVTFDSNGGTLLDPVTLDYGSNIEGFVTAKPGDIFLGWYLEDTKVDTVPDHEIVVHAKWHAIEMVEVGLEGTTYEIPLGSGNNGRADVLGGYLMATTETTYELWHLVMTWAVQNGYQFGNEGREGSHGTDGALPTEEGKTQPVTHIRWHDVLVWTNALSEMSGLDPVYRNGDQVLRDSGFDHLGNISSATQTEKNGYRLPTQEEWEMAARWRNEESDSTVFVGGRHWTSGDRLSGSDAPHTNQQETDRFSWHGLNSGVETHLVGLKVPNQLGLYDMAGNVWEWTMYTGNPFRPIYGGAANVFSDDLIIGSNTTADLFAQNAFYGFRLTRNP